MTERTAALAPGIPVARLVLWAVMAMLTLDGLQTYAIGPVPLSWLGRVAVIGLVGFLWLFRDLYRAPGVVPLLVVLAWGIAVTVGNAIVTDYAIMSPVFATTAYPVYLVLRWLWLLSFIATLALVFWLFVEGCGDAFIRWLVHLAALVALAAIYIYFAQINGWWEPPRTRIGTGIAAGLAEQATNFVGLFHRAMGTFREPSHLGAWLVLPLWLSFTGAGWRARAETLVIGLTIALTVSLGTILALLFGFAGALVLTDPLRKPNLRLIAIVVLLLAAATAVFQIVAVAYGAKVGLVAALWDRIAPMLAGGLDASNRGAVFRRYFETFGVIPPLVGIGWGHVPLILATRGAYLGNVATSNFFLYTGASIGMIGLIGWIAVLVTPVVRVLLRPALRADRLVFVTMAAFGAHLVMLNVFFDEPPMLLAVAMAILGYVVWHHDRGEA